MKSMKKSIMILLGVYVVALISMGISVYADADAEDAHGKPLEVVLQEIREKYGISPDETINPRKVNDKDLEELGEALMGVMHPDPRQHELMDDMMGGEGSESLASMHRMMGYRYLSGESYSMMGGGMMNMMDNGMMGGGMMGSGMMGRGLMFFPFGGLIMWLLIVAVVGVIVYLIVRAQKIGGRGSLIAKEGMPLDIAKKRYARGEISREEYEDIKQIL
jgi:uncharacterized membrane protein